MPILQHIDSAYNIELLSNKGIVKFMVYYQLKDSVRDSIKPGDYELYEMPLDIDITTYQNKIRMYLSKDVKDEHTVLGYRLYTVDQPLDLESLYNSVMKDVQKWLNKKYGEYYNFIF